MLISRLLTRSFCSAFFGITPPCLLYHSHSSAPQTCPTSVPLQQHHVGPYCPAPWQRPSLLVRGHLLCPAQGSILPRCWQGHRPACCPQRAAPGLHKQIVHLAGWLTQNCMEGSTGPTPQLIPVCSPSVCTGVGCRALQKVAGKPAHPGPSLWAGIVPGYPDGTSAKMPSSFCHWTVCGGSLQQQATLAFTTSVLVTSKKASMSMEICGVKCFPFGLHVLPSAAFPTH